MAQTEIHFMEEQLMRTLKVLCCAFTLLVFTAPSTNAQTTASNRRTFLTFSGPVQIPGKTLPAGTYRFELADLVASRNVLQIYDDKNGGKLIATLLTVPDMKLEAPEENVVMFGERRSGTPQAVKAWWYPGNPSGQELVYPRSEAVQIAKATGESVLAIEDEASSAEAMRGVQIGRVEASGQMVDDDASVSHTAEAAPTPQPSTPASVGTAGQARDNAADTAAANRRELPRTAGALALVELLSGASFAGFLVARRLRRRFEENA